MWGLTPLLRHVGDDMGFAALVTWACGALYLACLASDIEGIQKSGLSFLSPSIESLFLFGASGPIPVFRFGHWWTLLSASWLHGGVLHILFNMFAVRNLAPPTAKLYGPGRTVIIYTVAGVCGFGLSTLKVFLPLVSPGAGFTLGASASICGLIGALLCYGRRTGSSQVGQQAKSMALSLVLFGLLVQGIDNWAHAGGFAGGYLTARILDPLRPERGNHVVAAVVCLALSFLAVAVSIVKGLAILR